MDAMVGWELEPKALLSLLTLEMVTPSTPLTYLKTLLWSPLILSTALKDFPGENFIFV